MSSHCMFGTLGRVAVIWPDATEREAVAKALVSFKYTDIRMFSSTRDFANYAKKSEIDWIITGAFVSESYSGLSLLADLRNGEDNQAVKFSLFIKKPDENECLDQAFELGLLSTHPIKFAPMDLLSEFGDLSQLIIKYRGILPLVAAHYARSYLNETGKHVSRLHLEESLLKHISFHPDVLFHIAEAEFIHGKRVEAVGHLRQAAMLSSEYARMAESMQSRFMSSQEVRDINSRLAEVNIIGIKSVMIVDHDTTVSQIIARSLEQMGVTKIIACQSGVEALAWMKLNGSVDLLITEWKLAGKVSGTALVQRARQRGFGQMKIMVISSLLKQSDEDLLNEVGVDIVLPKPFNNSAFIEAVVAIKINDFGKRSSAVMLRKIRALLSSGNHELAESCIGDFLGLPEAEIAHKREVEALWAYHLNDYQTCVKLVSEALALGNNDASALTLMGRALLKLKDFKSASQFLERALVISPNNIQRLLDLSDAQVGAGNIDSGKAAIEKASAIDSTNEWVLMAECRIAIEDGDTQTARSLFSEIGSGSEIIAQMNNRAIALALLGKVNESIGIYVKTLDALPVSWKTQVAKVTFNLGMACARNGFYEKSEQVLASVVQIADKELGNRAHSLGARIKQAREAGLKFTFQISDAERSSSTIATPSGPACEIAKQSVRSLVLSARFRPGDICLYRIYVDIEGAMESGRSSNPILTSVKGAKAS